MDDSLVDLIDDFVETQTLITSASQILENHHTRLESIQESFYPDTYTYLVDQTISLKKQYAAVSADVASVRAKQNSWTPENMQELIVMKKKFADLVRVLQSSLASVQVAANWQSPSFAHTTLPQSGMRMGNVEANTNDYLRDYNLDEEGYVRKFVQEYVDHPLRLPPRAYLTSSAMAGLTTILTHLRSNMSSTDIVLVGKTSYFQNKLVAEYMFPGQIQYVVEFDTDNLVALAKRLQPRIILLDTLCGTDSLDILNLSELLPKLSDVVSRRSTLVLDNTSLATMCQPLQYLPINPLGMQLAVVASLSKYYECGLDRVNGGVVWTPVGSLIEFGQSRMHLGTNMSDASLCALPVPNRTVFDKRMLRIGRNARMLAECLQEIVVKTQGPVEGIVYPGLPSHTSYTWAHELSFAGGVLVFEFKPKYKKASYCEFFAQRIMEEAKKQNVDIICGTGFGFNTTRLYYTTRHANATMKPFVRLSLGTEALFEIERIALVFNAVLKNL